MCTGLVSRCDEICSEILLIIPEAAADNLFNPSVVQVYTRPEHL